MRVRVAADEIAGVAVRQRSEQRDVGEIELHLAGTLTAADLRVADAPGVLLHGYLDHDASVALEAGAGAIVTDSGSVQEEASALGVSCFTLRETSERPITLTHGTNVLLGEDPAEIAAVRPSQRPPTPAAIPLWDGHAGERVADVLVANYALLSTAT